MEIERLEQPFYILELEEFRLDSFGVSALVAGGDPF